MHALLLLAALLLAATTGGLGALLLRLVPAGGRRPLAFVVLAAPAFVLGLAVLHLVPALWPACTPLDGWDRVVSIALLAALATAALGGLVVNAARLWQVERLLRSCPAAGDALVSRTAALAERLGVAAPAVRILPAGGPLAASGGLRRPTVVLSPWLIERLDERELDGVLAHELAHLARRDHLAGWLGRLLRDMMAYLPSSWYALRVLQEEEELGADAVAVEATRRPLAMASALGKVWRGALGARSSAGLAALPGYAGSAAPLIGAGGSLSHPG